MRLARDHGCRLMVDEAHATGALGPGGRGSVAAAGLTEEVDVVVGTLGKALGSYGAYVCAERRGGRVPAQHAPAPSSSRPRPPPPSVAAAGAALELLESDPRRIERLRANAAGAARGARRRGPRRRRRGDPDRAGRGRRRRGGDGALRARPRAGVFAQGIRPPTVPEGSSRLRFTVMATHREAELRAAARVRRRRRARARGIATAARRERLPSPSPPRRARRWRASS